MISHILDFTHVMTSCRYDITKTSHKMTSHIPTKSSYSCLNCIYDMSACLTRALHSTGRTSYKWLAGDGGLPSSCEEREKESSYTTHCCLPYYRYSVHPSTMQDEILVHLQCQVVYSTSKETLFITTDADFFLHVKQGRSI